MAERIVKFLPERYGCSHLLGCGVFEDEKGNRYEQHRHIPGYSGSISFTIEIPDGYKSWKYGDIVEVQGTKYKYLGTDYEKIVLKHAN